MYGGRRIRYTGALLQLWTSTAPVTVEGMPNQETTRPIIGMGIVGAHPFAHVENTLNAEIVYDTIRCRHEFPFWGAIVGDSKPIIDGKYY